MKSRRLVLGIALCAASLTFALGCARRLATAPSYRIEVSDDLQRVSIHAENTPLNTLLGELNRRYGIDVRPDHPSNSLVSVDIRERPLAEAISSIVPKDIRYSLRTGERELAIAPHGTGRKEGAPLPDGVRKPEKGRQSRLPLPSGTLVKAPPDAIAVRTVPSGQGYKLVAERLVQVSPGRGPKQTKGPALVGDRTLRLRFTMMSSGEIRLDSAALIDGSTVPNNRVVGPMLYAIRRANGSLVSFGTFEDPLEEHSYLQDGKHTLERTKEGSFGLSLPGALLREGLQGITIQFFDARSLTLPLVLDEKTFGAVSQKATRLRDVRGEEIRRMVREVPQ